MSSRKSQFFELVIFLVLFERLHFAAFFNSIFLKNFGGMGWRGTFWFGLSGRNNKRVSWQREKDWKYLGMRFGSLVFP